MSAPARPGCVAQRTTLLDAALGYAALGWAVFPLTPNGKVPLYANPHPSRGAERAGCRGECGRWGHGVLDADTDPATITEWWTRTPSANIGLATGAPGPDVVDIDTKNGAPGMETLARLRDAGLLCGAGRLVRTPSGGVHLYYQGTGQGNGSLSRHGVDYRGAGGYVVAPPSAIGPNAYQLVEERPATAAVNWAAIRDHLCPARRLGWRPKSGDHSGLIRHVERQTEGNRNNALYWAACRAAERGAGRDVFHELIDASVRNGLSESAASATVKSAIKTIWGDR